MTQIQQIAKTYSKWSEIIIERFWMEIQSAETEEQRDVIEKKYIRKIKTRNALNLSKLRIEAVKKRMLEERK